MMRLALPSQPSALLATMAMTFAALLTTATLSIAEASEDDPPKTGTDASLTEFTLVGNAPPDWLERLKKLPNVRKLTVCRPDLKVFKANQLKDLQQLTSFRAVNFPLESRLADAVAVKLADLPNLQSIAFERTGLTSRGLQFLRDSSIAELRLTEEELLTDEAYEHVGKMKSLRKLVLDATPIDSVGLKHLQRCPQLRRFALRRHPAGSNEDGADSRLASIAGLNKLEELELESAAYERLVVLKQIESLKRLTLRHCGASEASRSLKQLKQLDMLTLDNCDIRDETFGDVRAVLAEVGIEVVEATPQARTDLLTRGSTPANEATRLAWQLHDGLDVAKQHPAFWLRWRTSFSDVPSMKSEPVRTIYRLRKALSGSQARSALEQETVMAWAPQQFYLFYALSEDGAVRWEQIRYGNAELARSRESSPGEELKHFIRNGVSEFADFFTIPDQLCISHQSFWWGVGTHPNAMSSVLPSEAVYKELPAETFAGETCRVLESAGRSERLWISQETGRLRGSLSFIHQGYFGPFHKQNLVTQIAGRPVASREEYRALFGDGEHALPEAKQRQLEQAWAEYTFDHAIPLCLRVFSDYRKIAPGRWFPFRVQSAGWQYNEQNQERYDFHCSESLVAEVALDRDNLQKYWADALPHKGEAVQDQRYGVPVEYKYDEDRSDDEIQRLVTEQMFKYARSAMRINARTKPFENMIGKPAPALPTEQWIGERPDVKGRRYLIHCWAAWCGPCKNDVPLLNAVSKNRIVIGIHPSGTEMEQIQKTAADEKMAYPTVVAPPGAKDIVGYPATIFPYCIEIDENGNVARHGSLREVLGVGGESAPSMKPLQNASGEVLQTEPDSHLAAISLGEADGVQKGQIFHVVRDDRRVAQMRIVFVLKNRSVGKIVDEKKKAQVNKGDVVRRPLD